MKNQIAIKTVSNIVLVGLLVSIFSMNLAAKTLRALPQIPKRTSDDLLASWQTQRPSQAAIDSAIREAALLTSKLQTMKERVANAVLGIGEQGLAAGIGLIVVSILFASFPPAVGLGIFPERTTLRKDMPFIIDGVVTAIVSSYITGVPLTVITGGLTAEQIIKAIAITKTLKDIEKKYSGILTKAQIEASEKLNKVIKGPITKGFAKGTRLKKALQNAINQGLQIDPNLNKKTIQQYLIISKNVRNLELNINAHKEKIKKQIEVMDKYPRLSPAWYANNLKIIALNTNPNYTFLGIRLQGCKGKLKKHPEIEQKLAPAVQKHIEDADKITADLGNELDR